MKHLLKFNESVNKKELMNFLIDFGYMISLQFIHIKQYAIDNDAYAELDKLQSVLNKPLINGKKYYDIINDSKMISNPKLLSALINQIKLLIEYIEPRIQKYVKDCDNKKIWISNINRFKEDYIKIVS